MLKAFDWIRRAENGAELIATIDAINTSPELFQEKTIIGEVACGIRGPCSRCWILPRLPESSHCDVCSTILSASGNLGPASRECLLVWGYVNSIPGCLKKDGRSQQIRALFVKDDAHFLAVVPGAFLMPWMKEVILNSDPVLSGTLTVFPTTGKKDTFTMGDILCRAIQHDSRFPMDRLRIRFFSKPGQLKAPHVREKQGLLAFEIPEFLVLLEMAAIIQKNLHPKEREMLRDVSGIGDSHEKAFRWGRLMGALNIQTRDLLAGWELRKWPEHRIKSLCELAEYVNSTG